MRAIALGLDLDETFFEDKINEQRHNLRLLSYPSIETSLLKEGQTRAGAHSGGFPTLRPFLNVADITVMRLAHADYGTLALLFQDDVGGLEVENPHTKQFQPAIPMVCSSEQANGLLT